MNAAELIRDVSDPIVREILARQDRAIRTTAQWLAQTPGVWGVRDLHGIEKILDGLSDPLRLTFVDTAGDPSPPPAGPEEGGEAA